MLLSAEDTELTDAIHTVASDSSVHHLSFDHITFQRWHMDKSCFRSYGCFFPFLIDRFNKAGGTHVEDVQPCEVRHQGLGVLWLGLVTVAVT